MSEIVRDRLGRSAGTDILLAVFMLWLLLAHSVPWSTLGSGPAAPVAVQQLMTALINLFQSGGESHPALLGIITLAGYCTHASWPAPAVRPYRTYAVRQGFRILPIYLAGIAAGVVLWPVAGSADPQTIVAISGTASIDAGCLAKRTFLIGQLSPSLFDCTFQGNAPLNLLSVLVGLLLLYPLVRLADDRLGARKRVIYAVILAGILAGLVASNLPGLRGWWNNGTAFGFLAFWWIGALFSTPEIGRHRRLILRTAILFWIGCSALLAFQLDALFVVSELRELAFVLIVGALAVSLDGARLGRRPPLRSLAFIGRCGLILYALHAPIVYTLILWGGGWYVAFASAVLIGTGAYFVVEKPMKRVGDRLVSGDLAAPDNLPDAG